MNEDTTRDLPGATPFEQRVLAEFAALRQDNAALRQDNVVLRQEVGALRQQVGNVNARLTALEDKVDSRLRETRPLWEGVQSRLVTIEETLNDIRSHMKLIVKDLFQTRVRVEELEDRQRPPAA